MTAKEQLEKTIDEYFDYSTRGSDELTNRIIDVFLNLPSMQDRDITWTDPQGNIHIEKAIIGENNAREAIRKELQ